MLKDWSSSCRLDSKQINEILVSQDMTLMSPLGTGPF